MNAMLQAPAEPARRVTAARPVHVLHVVGGMNRGGAETWLMQVLRHIDRHRFRLDFLVDTGRSGHFDEEIAALGSSVLDGRNVLRPTCRASEFRRFLDAHGPYEIVHSHVHHYSGIVLRCAARAGVPIRIAHSHSDTLHTESRAPIVRRCYTAFTERWLRHYATGGIAVSTAAARSLFGSSWEFDSRFSVLYCGTDPTAFQAGSRDAASIRQEFGVPANARVIAHIGRFVEPKNHPFLIEIMGRIAALDPRAVFVLAGDGPLRPSIEAALRRAGIASRTRLLGIRSDVPRLLAGLIDVLLMPSLWEGLPMVTIESQAAGVPCLCSDAIPAEAVEIPSLLHRISLDIPADEWARQALAMTRQPGNSSLDGTRFDIRVGVRRLEQMYLDCIRRAERS